MTTRLDIGIDSDESEDIKSSTMAKRESAFLRALARNSEIQALAALSLLPCDARCGRLGTKYIDAGAMPPICDACLRTCMANPSLVARFPDVWPGDHRWIDHPQAQRARRLEALLDEARGQMGQR